MSNYDATNIVISTDFQNSQFNRLISQRSPKNERNQVTEEKKKPQWNNLNSDLQLSRTDKEYDELIKKRKEERKQLYERTIGQRTNLSAANKSPNTSKINHNFSPSPVHRI